MNKALTRKPEPSLYETDFAAWADEQARLLRAAAAGDQESSARIDWENVIEEIADLGDEKRADITSHLRTVLEHLLKLEYSPAVDPRNGWRVSISRALGDIEGVIERNPSLKVHLRDPGTLEAAYRYARRDAAKALELFDKVPPKLIPADCPYALADILDDAWEPANRHGIADRP